jgi:transposase InsO family protein
VPQVQRKRRRLGHGEDGCTRRRSERPNHVWSYDFIHDQTADGRGLKILPIVDEFTRECLAIEVERGMGAEDVVSTLEYLFEIRGEPEHIRSDNGPEFIAEAVRSWLARRGSKALYIAPGSPWEDVYSETFNSRLRDEILDRLMMDSGVVPTIGRSGHPRASCLVPGRCERTRRNPDTKAGSPGGSLDGGGATNAAATRTLPAC